MAEDPNKNIPPSGYIPSCFPSSDNTLYLFEDAPEWLDKAISQKKLEILKLLEDSEKRDEVACWSCSHIAATSSAQELLLKGLLPQKEEELRKMVDHSELIDEINRSMSILRDLLSRRSKYRN